MTCLLRASLGFPDSSVDKESTCYVGDPGSIPGSGRFTGEGIGYPLQYSWASLVAQLVKNPSANGRPGFDPWVGKIPWRGERLPTPVFWPGEFHGLYSPWGLKESDMTERLSQASQSLSCGDGGGRVARGKQFSQLPAYELPCLACWLDPFLDGQFQTARSALLPQEAASANSPFRCCLKPLFSLARIPDFPLALASAPSPLRESSSLFVLHHGCRITASAVMGREKWSWPFLP